MSELILIRVNCASQAEATAIGARAIDARLAACANVEGPVTSMYRWEGEIERDEEYILWLKTISDLWPELERLILGLHSFDTPAILSIPCQDVNERYEAWLRSSLKAPS